MVYINTPFSQLKIVDIDIMEVIKRTDSILITPIYMMQCLKQRPNSEKYYLGVLSLDTYYK